MNLRELNDKRAKKYGDKDKDGGFRPDGLVKGYIGTGSLALDVMLGGGIPKGKLVQIYGVEGSGKSTLLYTILGESNKTNLPAMLYDVEQSFGRDIAISCGIDVDNPELFDTRCLPYAESYYNHSLDLLKEDYVKIIGIDSIGAMSSLSSNKPQAENSKDSGLMIGSFARSTANWINPMIYLMGYYNVPLVAVNQVSMSIPIGGYGRPSLKPKGGNAFQFASTFKIKMKKGEKDKSTGSFISEVTVDKGKCGKVNIIGTCNLYITPHSGLNKELEACYLAVESCIIEKSGAWFKYKENKWQGMENVIKELRENEPLFNEIKEKVLLAYKPTVNPEMLEDQDEPDSSETELVEETDE
jgi:recombination protein RecA